MSEIQNWYTGKNILITGGTGFVGKVLVERLLRDCHTVNSLYLVVRARGKQNFDARCEAFYNHMIFDYLRKSHPKQLAKIKIIQGDLTQTNIGLSNENLTIILNNIDIIVHAGADVRFDLPLRDLVGTNTNGTRRLLELAKQIEKLQIFVFVSTAYSQSNQKLTEERPYTAVMDVHALEKALDRFDDWTMTALQPKILKDFPNTYSFSKHLTEDVVYRYSDTLPICVVRPTIISSALYHPMPGYTDGLNGLNGWAYASGRGVLRTIQVDLSAPFHTIPVDIVANTIIAASWIHGTKKVDHIEYYNANTAPEHLLTGGQNKSLINRVKWEYPSKYAVWYPNCTLSNCIYYCNMRIFFYQILPSVLLDLLILMFRQKPILLKVQRKIHHGQSLINPYLQMILFKTVKFTKLRGYLNDVDNEIFDTNMDRVTALENAHLNALGFRKFLSKEMDEDLPSAKRHILMYGDVECLFWVHMTLRCIVGYYLVKFIAGRIF